MTSIFRKSGGDDSVQFGANISRCGTFRYLLSRMWDPSKPVLMFVMLNPSTADAMKNDPTIMRCIFFARLFGYGGILVGNLFAYRATDPRDLKANGYQVGPDNDHWLKSMMVTTYLSGGTLCYAWGAVAREHPERVAEINAMAKAHGLEPHCLKTMSDGTPRHPLYLPSDCKLEPVL